MGAWGVGLFDNDAAMDWAGDFIDDGGGLARAETTLRWDPGEYFVDGPDPEAALAAAAMIAASRGADIALPDQLTTWLAGTDPATDEQARTATAAVELVLSPGADLYSRWRPAPNFDEWAAGVRALWAALRV